MALCSLPFLLSPSFALAAEGGPETDPGSPGSQLPWMSLFALSPFLLHCLREQPAPDSLLKQSADILVKTNLILFLFWDRWEEIDAFVSNQKKKEAERQYTSFLFDSHFFGTKAAGCHSSRDLTAFREAGARLVSRKGSFDGQSIVLFSLWGP